MSFQYNYNLLGDLENEIYSVIPRGNYISNLCKHKNLRALPIERKHEKLRALGILSEREWKLLHIAILKNIARMKRIQMKGQDVKLNLLEFFNEVAGPDIESSRSFINNDGSIDEVNEPLSSINNFENRSDDFGSPIDGSYSLPSQTATTHEEKKTVRKGYIRRSKRIRNKNIHNKVGQNIIESKTHISKNRNLKGMR